MADNRCSAYSFYVPLGDTSLNGFVEAQSNLSMTIRLLIKGFIYNCGGEYPDVSVMDLKELIARADIGPELLAELEIEERKRGRTAGKRYAGSAEAAIEPEGKPEETIDLGQDQEQDEDEDENDDEVPEESGDAAEDTPSADGDPEERDDIVDMSAVGEGDEDEADAGEPEESEAPEEEPEEEPGGISEEGPEDSGDDPEDEDEQEPEPAKGSSRAAYNKQQDAEASSIDDIMSLMGDY